MSNTNISNNKQAPVNKKDLHLFELQYLTTLRTLEFWPILISFGSFLFTGACLLFDVLVLLVFFFILVFVLLFDFNLFYSKYICIYFRFITFSIPIFPDFFIINNSIIHFCI